jgi:TetR/AcrR family transcriptional repressor of nem operon
MFKLIFEYPIKYLYCFTASGEGMARQKTFQRDDVVDRAIDVFMAKGYEGSTVNDLVGAAGLHPGSLYNAFGSKQGLYQAALERFDAMSPFNQLLGMADTAPPRESIKRILQSVVDPDPNGGGVAGCLITFAAAEVGETKPEIADSLHQAFQRMENRLCRFIERGQRCGEFSSTQKPRELAQFLLSTIQGIQVMSKVTSNKRHLRAAAQVAFAALDQVNPSVEEGDDRTFRTPQLDEQKN